MTAITTGTKVVGHITNQGRRIDFTGVVADAYRTHGRSVVTVACDDGPERTACAENVTALTAPLVKLTPNMVKTLRNLVHHNQVSAEGTLVMNEKGCTYPALEALVRRGLAEVVGSGQTRPRFDGGTYEPRVYQPTISGREAFGALAAS
ncbi:hypothetical protein [Streptomyces lavendulae]|uniref:hypothetical protein n=1 Tax=Streptomyces lavendulae TaxID=1914 RepID=UPI00340C27A8